MKKPSFERFNYSLRPAKNIERKNVLRSFCETVTHRSSAASIDILDLVRTHLLILHFFIKDWDITDMISIEGFDENKSRLNLTKGGLNLTSHILVSR